MKNSLLYLAILFSLFSCGENREPSIRSPDGHIRVTTSVDSSGGFCYLVNYKEKTLIDSSGFAFRFKNLPDFDDNLEIISVKKRTHRRVWKMPWGEQEKVINHYCEMRIKLREKSISGRRLSVIYRVYNDGLGFRYEFGRNFCDGNMAITEEATEFRLTCDPITWWIPGDWDIYEHLYNETRFSEIDALSKANHEALAQSYIPFNAVNTPVTMKTDKGVYMSFHEANLTNYADMTLLADRENLSMRSILAGNYNGIKASVPCPFHTPWRTIQITERAGDLIESKLIVNLNEPNKLGDISWFKPAKYVGIWWDMHIGTKEWNYAGGKHGATTDYAKELIDFASDNNIGAILVEGWNTGWENWFGDFDREGVFDFVTPYPDYDLKKVVEYGKSKGVELIMHHETSAAPRVYEKQLDTAYTLMNKLGIHSVKTGYVGKIIPKGHYHHDQWMIRHYRHVVETAAKYQIAVNAHEPIKATGLRRTYPNIISREGLRGQEFNAWSPDGGNPPDHLPIIAFTRMLAGPIDFTPGIFNIKLKPYKDYNQVNTTLCHQLALYVVIYSPIQMVPDLIKHYRGHPEFQFIRDVGVNWEETRVLNGEIGDYVTIVRKERETGNWFLGSITNETAREFEISCHFLDKGKIYDMTVYADADNAHWDKNPTAAVIRRKKIMKNDKLKIKCAPGGGCAVSFLLNR